MYIGVDTHKQSHVWDRALMVEDTCHDYGEPRLRVLALLQGRLHAVVVTPRRDELRVVSFGNASRKEVRLYAHHQATQP